MARNNRQPRRNNHSSPVKLLQRPENGPGDFADASVDAFLMFDENLNLVSINPAGEKLLGVSREADIGKNITDIVPDIRRIGRYENYLSVIETGSPFFADDIIPHPRFGDKHLSIKAFKIWQGVGMIVSDITESKRVEEALKESEESFRAIFESAVDGMVLADPETRELYTANRMFCQMLGYSLEEIKNMGIKDLHPEEALPYVGQQFEKQVRGEITLARDIPVKRKDGSIFYVEVNSSLVTVAEKSYIMGIFRDITERKKAEEALRESELLATVTIEGMSDGVMLVGMDGKVAYINKAFEKMLGYKIEELVGTSAVELPTYHGSKDRKKARQALKRVIEKGSAEPIDMVALSKEGMEIPINFTASVVKDAKGNPKTLVAVIRDVTERRKAEEALRQSEEHFRALVENSHEAIVVLKGDGTISFGTTTIERMLGYTGEDLLGTGGFGFAHPDDMPKVMESFTHLMENPSSVVDTELRIQHKDGSWRIVEAVARNLLGNKAVEGIVINWRDITERKVAEEALRQSEEKLRIMFEAIAEGVTVTDLQGNMVQVNEAVLRLHGYSRKEEILGRHAFELISPKDHVRAQDNLRKTSEEGQIQAIEYTLLTKDGKEFEAELTAAVLEDRAGNETGFIALTRDITERKKAEEALKRSEEYFRALMENSLDAVTIMNEDGTIRYESPSYEGLLGFKPEDKVGSNLFERINPDDITRVAELFAEFLPNRGGTLHTDVRAQHKNGSWRSIEATGSNLLDNPVVKGIVVNLRDITERKRAEEALRESEAKLKLYLDNSPDAIYIIDAMGNFLYGNIAAEKAVGYSKEEILGKSFVELSLLSDEQLWKAAQLHELNLAGKPTGPQEYELTRKDGSRVFVEISTYPTGEGDKLEVVGIARDITERKKAQEELEENRRRLDIAVEASQIGVWELDLISDTSIRNLRHDQIFGYEEVLAEWGAKIFFEHIIPEDRPSVKAAFDEAMKTGKLFFECRIIWPDESIHWITATAKAFGDSTGKPIKMLGTVTDVTERRKAEEVLRESEERFRAIFDNSVDGILVTDLETKSFYMCNKAMCQMLGYNLEEMRNLKVTDIHPKKDLPYVIEEMERERQGESRGGKVLPLERKDGSVLYAEVTPSLVTFAGRQYLAGIFRDISERKRAEEALKSSEERYRLVVDNANEAIVVAQDGMLKFFNSRVIEILGYSKEEMASKPFIELVHPDDQQMVVGRYMARLGGEELPSIYSFRVVDKAGNFRWVEINAVVINWEGRPATLNFLTDITERKKAEEEKQRMEEQLLLAGRLAAVGELSAGVAHELNNPIAAIQGFAQLLAARNDLDETTKKDLGIVYREAQRAAKIIQNLLSFARKHESEKQFISLNEVIEKTLELHAYQMKLNNIEVVVDFAADLPKTLADFFQMQQVFVNLVSNAEQAMVGTHGKGRLVVKTQRVGGMIRISFADNGPGIPEENMKRIFDPFFTTKEVGKGTGLGLSICYGLVEAHGGRIYVRSKLGEGATFVVEIPIISEGQ